ncbi:MAG TPA: DoxX family protein [Candidatus Eremiobacteraceae bacterium]|nr:DoxX family protein [Candidatus Eremiobacteraceae bacterium]
MEVAIGLLLARVIIGLGLAAHGAQKLFGWFGGYGLAGTAGFFESLGFKPGTLFAFMAGVGELLGGLLTFAGWLNPIGPALIIAIMIVAIGSVHLAKGYWQANGGYELNLAYIAGALLVAFGGAGRLSVDALAPVPALAHPATGSIVIAIAVVGGLLSLAIRHRPKAAQTQAAAG